MTAFDFIAALSARGIRVRNDGALLVTGKLTDADRVQLKEWKPMLLGVLPRIVCKEPDGSYWVEQTLCGVRSICHEDYAGELFNVPSEMPRRHHLLKKGEPNG